MHRRRWLGLLAVFLLAPWASFCLAADKPLTLALFPNLSPRVLLTIYQPVRDFLEQELGRPVGLVTAPSFEVFVQRMLAREYDCIVAAPHFARLAQRDAGYELLAHYEQPLRGLFIVREEAGIKSIGDLAGKTVAMPDRLAIITSLGLDMLAGQHLRPGEQFRLIDAKSHNNAALAVASGHADAAVIGSIPYMQLSKGTRGGLKIIAESKPIPSQYIAASDRLPAGERERLTRALIKFAQTAGGKKFLHEFDMQGIVKAKPGELREMDALATQLRQWLNETPSPR